MGCMQLQVSNNTYIHQFIMALFSVSSSGSLFLSVVVVVVVVVGLNLSWSAEARVSLPKTDVDLLEFPLNLEYLEADFFSWGALGKGIDSFEPNLTMGGPPPLGVQKARLSPLIRDIIAQFAFQEFGHLR